MKADVEWLARLSVRGVAGSRGLDAAATTSPERFERLVLRH